MPIYPTLKKAPIAEAIVNVEVSSSHTSSIEDVLSICKNLKNKYPSDPEHWNTFEGEFKIDNGEVSASHSAELLGYIIKSSDDKNILHIGKQALILNKLRPYKNWDDLSLQFKHAWDKYTEIIAPSSINRIGIRYINSFDVPVKNWNSYILMHPAISTENEFDKSSISMGEIFSRYNLKSDRYVSEAVVLLNIKAVDSKNLSIIMDIDVKSINKISNYTGYHEIKDVIDRLRDFKNQIFFSNLPKAKELFS